MLPGNGAQRQDLNENNFGNFLSAVTDSAISAPHRLNVMQLATRVASTIAAVLFRVSTDSRDRDTPGRTIPPHVAACTLV